MNSGKSVAKWYPAAVCAVLAALLLLTACRKPADAGKAELDDAGYAMTQGDWFRAVEENNVSVMKRFVQAGMDWKAADGEGNLAIHRAATAGAREAAGFLLEKGMDVNVRGAAGLTPLMNAAVHGRGEMVRWMLRHGGDPQAVTEDGYNALMLAVKEGQAGAVQELAVVQRSSLDQGLLLASLTGRHEVIDTLTSHGASVYVTMEDGRTPLMLAAENGHEDAVRLLLDIGANRHAVDENGLSAGEHAAANGYHEIVMLIRNEKGDESVSLAGPVELKEEMGKVVDRALGDGHGGEGGTGRRAGAVAMLEGAELSAAVPAGGATGSGTRVEGGAVEVALPPLAMRFYQERQVPLRVISVEQGNARVEMEAEPRSEALVAVGQELPGTSIVLVRAERRMQEGKLNLGQPMEVSVVEVRDTRTGVVREWLAGQPATAHDPVAVVEDEASGQMYVASAGQRFRSADGVEFVVRDVRSNQIVIEDVASGEVVTLPLRGPRG